MIELRSEIVNGVAKLLEEQMNLDFTQQHLHLWLVEGIYKYSEDGWRYHNVKNLSNHYRFQVWLLHIKAYVKMKHLDFMGSDISLIEAEQLGFKNQIDDLMSRIKVYDKMN